MNTSKQVNVMIGLMFVFLVGTLLYFVWDTLRCGRVVTLMPAWAEDQGGPLNAFQILQLVALITGAMPGEDAPRDPNAVSLLGWESVLENADHTDLLAGEQLGEAGRR